MNRRNFLQQAMGTGIALPVALGGMSVRAMANSPIVQSMAGLAANSDKILVLLQMQGGNDGLNMVVPLDQYSRYSTVRPTIALPEASVLRLGSTGSAATMGLHPAMTGLKSLYDDGRVTLVQGVSYPSPNFSHSRSTDIWMTASDSNQTLVTGWNGRFLDVAYPNYPENYPNPAMPDPLAIQISAQVSTMFRSAGETMAVALTDPQAFYNLVNGTGASNANAAGEVPDNTLAGQHVAYVRQIQAQSMEYASSIKRAADKATNRITYAANNPLAAQLAIVARLIAGGLKTRVYAVQIGGFDTHVNQVTAGTPIAGTHSQLMLRISDAIKNFQDDLRLLGVDDKVLGMTFSEFGRRVEQNSSVGTDHGTSAPVFFFGKNVQPGIIGVNPSLTNLVNGNNLAMQYDFRQLYASVLSQWFSATSDELFAAVRRDPTAFTQIPIVRSSATSVRNTPTGANGDAGLLRHFPNPASSLVNIEYKLPTAGMVTVKMYDMQGRELATVRDAYEMSGQHSILFDVSALPQGVYFYRMTYNEMLITRQIVVQR
jgi:uncharacterized protein (DUF1501 family)